MDKIRIAVCGMGNLGMAVERNIGLFPDMELAGLFSRRDIKGNSLVFPYEDILKFKDDVDVMLICTGSSSDTPKISPCLAGHFNIVDSYDNHQRLKEHFLNVDREAKKNHKTALIAMGWDPGLFSLMRLLNSCIMPNGNLSTFYGKGISFGHSEAARQIEGIKDAVSFTLPVKPLLRKAREGEAVREKTVKRECFVSLEDGADEKKIEKAIKSLPDYFSGYDTKVNFAEDGEVKRYKKSPFHKGEVVGSLIAGKERFVSDFRINLTSNADFTALLMLTFARAVFHMKNVHDFGAKTIFDIKPKWLIIEGSDNSQYL